MWRGGQGKRAFLCSKRPAQGLVAFLCLFGGKNAENKECSLLAGPLNKGMLNTYGQSLSHINIHVCVCVCLGSLLHKELGARLNSHLANPIDATTEIYPKDFTLEVKEKLKYSVFNLGLFRL
jgi:hypothetical protein